jgi:hypothetical protein
LKNLSVLFLLSAAILSCSTARVYGLAEATGPGGSNAQAVHQLGQTGAGVKIGLISVGNVFRDHEAFFNEDANDARVGDSHVTNVDFTGAGESLLDHDTWMAGIMGSRGGKYGSHPNDIGVAPGVDITSGRISSYSQLSNAFTSLITNYNSRVIVSGIADPCYSPDGQSQLTLIYDYFAEEYDVLFANPAGNGYSVIWPPGDAYNAISTGGLLTGTYGVYDRAAPISSSGFTADGRMKPDITAPANDQNVPDSGTNIWKVPVWNDGRTSLAVPHTAGTAALLLGLTQTDANYIDAGHNEVLRAIIINSAFENIKSGTGASTYPLDPNNVWQKDRGYGRIDALRAYLLLSAGKITKGTPTIQNEGWAYATMNSLNQYDHYYITGQKNQRLVLTLTWNRKPTRTFRLGGYVYSDESAPKFRLNFSVNDPNGLPLYSITDPNDNTRKVELRLPYGGLYDIAITNSATKSGRNYGLAYELIPPMVADFNIDYIVDYNDLQLLTLEWLQIDSVCDLIEPNGVDFSDYSILAGNFYNSNPLYH